VVKHANPCGVALAPTIFEAYSHAHGADPISAFGGIIAFNRPIDGPAAEAVSRQFVEVLMAPGFSEDALRVLKAKANVRLLEIALPPGGATDWERGRNAMDVKRVGSGMLIQTADNHVLQTAELKVVTQLQPDAAQLGDLMFAWTVARHVKSNAIVYANGGATAGIGAGQMSRLDSTRIAARKAIDAAETAGWPQARTIGSCVASDAFFPFADGLIAAAEAGATAIIQPGGSIRDKDVIAAADERGLAMVLTGMRHFRH
jgi:phosphoribosylaminoimidazolecarboxamide formyltransferase/IMP cyclohydrolase